MQKYVLGRPIMLTKSFGFAVAFMCLFSTIIALFKVRPSLYSIQTCHMVLTVGIRHSSLSGKTKCTSTFVFRRDCQNGFLYVEITTVLRLNGLVTGHTRRGWR